MLLNLIKRLMFIITAIFVLLPVGAVADVLHDEWDNLLRTHVRDGLVDYQGFKKNEERLDKYLLQLAKSPVPSSSANERLAYYINAYNAYTIKLILKNFKNGEPPGSIKDIGGFFQSPWTIRFVVLNNETYSLDNIEHDIIRKEFNEPRVHFAVNCASKSCPPLLAAAYTGDKLNQQLNQNSRAFINNRRFNRLEGDTLYVSKIFSWFGEDFSHDIIGFVTRYGDEKLIREIKNAGDKLRVKFLDYDWSLNSL